MIEVLVTDYGHIMLTAGMSAHLDRCWPNRRKDRRYRDRRAFDAWARDGQVMARFFFRVGLCPPKKIDAQGYE